MTERFTARSGAVARQLSDAFDASSHCLWRSSSASARSRSTTRLLALELDGGEALAQRRADRAASRARRVAVPAGVGRVDPLDERVPLDLLASASHRHGRQLLEPAAVFEQTHDRVRHLGCRPDRHGTTRLVQPDCEAIGAEHDRNRSHGPRLATDPRVSLDPDRVQQDPRAPEQLEELGVAGGTHRNAVDAPFREVADRGASQRRPAVLAQPDNVQVALGRGSRIATGNAVAHEAAWHSGGLGSGPHGRGLRPQLVPQGGGRAEVLGPCDGVQVDRERIGPRPARGERPPEEARRPQGQQDHTGRRGHESGMKLGILDALGDDHRVGCRGRPRLVRKMRACPSPVADLVEVRERDDPSQLHVVAGGGEGGGGLVQRPDASTDRASLVGPGRLQIPAGLPGGNPHDDPRSLAHRRSIT